MAIITRQDFDQLAGIQDTTCVSIFIPTHRTGQEVLQQKDAIVLKNQLKEVTAKLEKEGLSDNEIKSFLEPAFKLVEDTHFWRHQSDGLAIFMANGFFREFQLPVQFDALNYVSNALYLKPLMPMFGGDGRFFILALELRDVNFYEGTRHSIAEVYIDDLTPSRLEEAVGFDYRQEFLQFRTQQEGHGQATFHGHGDRKADRRDEIRKYFRAINDGLMKMLHDEYPPMVVASLDYLFPIYKEVNDYKHLMDAHITGNPADSDVLDLHAKAWEILQPHFDTERRVKLDRFTEMQTKDQTASDIKQVIPAALSGKVDTLFLQKNSDVYGIYDPGDQSVELRGNHGESAVSLLNLAAIKVFQQGGHVYLLDKEDMPNPNSIINALYRY